MSTRIPALKARMGDREYYVGTMPLGLVGKLVSYAEEVEGWDRSTDPSLKTQRELNWKRIQEEMAPYLIENPNHFYSAIVVEVRDYADPSKELDWRPVTIDGSDDLGFGMLCFDGTESMLPLDGQHRWASIREAIRQKPELAKEKLAVIFVHHISRERSQMMFSDLNRYAKAPAKSINLLFDHRDPYSVAAKRIIGEIPLLQNRVNLEGTSLGKGSAQFITLSTLYEMVKALSKMPDGKLPAEPDVDELVDIWHLLVDAIPAWKEIETGRLTPAHARTSFISVHGVGQQAIALAVRSAMHQRPDEWRNLVLKGLSQVKWETKHEQWEGVCVYGTRINNTRQTIQHTSTLIQHMLGLEVDPTDWAALVAVAVNEEKFQPFLFVR